VSRFPLETHTYAPASQPAASIKISVVTISYNQNLFLERTILSVLNQGYPNLEYIIMDGGSTDGSIETIRKYEHHLAFWRSGPDGGPGAALNAGLARCTGDIVGYLNSDDFYLPGTMAKMATTFNQRPEVDVVYGNGYFADVKDNLTRPIYSDPWSLRRFAFGGACVIQPGSFFRLEAFRKTAGFNEASRTSWDAELWVDLALAGARFLRSKEFFAAFRLHPDSITGSQRIQAAYEKERNALFNRIVGRDASVLDRTVRRPLWRIRKHSELMIRRLSVGG
jgi:glycosyltransferase involved in cell wall biosynthesis